MTLSVSGPVLRMRGPEEGSVLRASPNPGRIHVLEEHLLEIMPNRNLPRLAALLVEVEHPLFAGMIKIAAAESGHGAGASGGINKNGDDGAIAQSDDGREVLIDASNLRA